MQRRRDRVAERNPQSDDSLVLSLFFALFLWGGPKLSVMPIPGGAAIPAPRDTVPSRSRPSRRTLVKHKIILTRGVLLLSFLLSLPSHPSRFSDAPWTSPRSSPTSTISLFVYSYFNQRLYEEYLRLRSTTIFKTGLSIPTCTFQFSHWIVLGISMYV